MSSTTDEAVDAPDPLHTPPQPIPDHDSAGFWKATADGKLQMCQCTSCGLWMQPPLERCRKCNAPTEFRSVAGTGVLYTFIVQHHAVTVGYVDNLPYVVGVIEFDEQKGLRLPGRVVGIPAAQVKVGMRVKVELERLPGGDFVVPVFLPA